MSTIQDWLDANPGIPPEAACLICERPVIDHDRPPTPFLQWLRTKLAHYSYSILWRIVG